MAESIPDVPAEPCPDLVATVAYPKGYALNNGETLRVKADGWLAEEGDLMLSLRCNSGEIVLQWSASDKQKRVARNSWIGSSWGVAEEGGAWPYGVCHRPFEVDFKRTPSKWEISVNGSRCPDLDFSHRSQAGVTGVEASASVKNARVLLVNRRLPVSRWGGDAPGSEGPAGSARSIDEVRVECAAADGAPTPAAKPGAAAPPAPPSTPAPPAKIAAPPGAKTVTVPDEPPPEKAEKGSVTAALPLAASTSSKMGCSKSMLLDPRVVRRETAKAIVTAIVSLAVLFGALGMLVVEGSRFEAECPELADNESAPELCKPCGEGLLVLPVGREWEQDQDLNVRAVFYFLGLGWCFLGVAIVCDQFMAAIEEITSKERVVWLEAQGGTRHKFRVHVWNPTIANLTLMALGSSAPEILLSVIELIGNNFFAGELGPSTIVGSAAFNLLVITGVCISAVPDPEVRKIDCIEVFAVTASVSIFAYIWLIIILLGNSPNLVSLPEAIITFLFFPLLVFTAFCADKGLFSFKPSRRASMTACIEQIPDSRVQAEKARLEKLFGKQLNLDTVRLMVAGEQAHNNKSKAQHRLGVMRAITGGLKPLHARRHHRSEGIKIGFSETQYMVLECEGSVKVTVMASKAPGCQCKVRFFTHDGHAKSGSRYKQTEGTLSFGPTDVLKTIEIPIYDNDVWDADEEFTIELADLQILEEDVKHPHVSLGQKTTTVTILNDDEPGTLAFTVEEVMACEGVESVMVGISRTNGSCGKITCSYATVDDSAIQDYDYTQTEGNLELEDGETEFKIELPILQQGVHEDDRRFRIVLNDASPGVKFYPEREPGDHGAVCEVVLHGNRLDTPLHRCARSCFNKRKCVQGLSQWAEQFPAAIFVCGSIDAQESASFSDWIFHCISLFWKVLFAFVPPPAIGGGWVCFFGALGMIGCVTALVGDMANLLGCCIGMPVDITAITLVALGTSLPDTFASMSSAQHDSCADNSIGNVTGSNSVNVFLGLGLPWLAGAIYWSGGKTEDWENKWYAKGSTPGPYSVQVWHETYPKGGFIMPAGSLAFSVAVFVATAFACVGLLVFRRFRYNGELGGPAVAARRDSVFLCVLWLSYVGISAWYSFSGSG